MCRCRSWTPAWCCPGSRRARLCRIPSPWPVRLSASGSAGSGWRSITVRRLSRAWLRLCSSPGWLRTESIRVGSGGVMLPNHLPFIVAEQFGSIGAFGGGRIDLGIGKGTGAANATVADMLRRGAPAPSDEAYASEVRQLLGYFTPGGSSGAGAPMPESYPPQVWLLGSGESSAALAAELGLPMAVAQHIRPGANRTELSAAHDGSGRPVHIHAAGAAGDSDLARGRGAGGRQANPARPGHAR
jgi:alkanesulfonate monooxygenase SsuD/methylene tetrahydromethanopterin reductase-like flavin-dependent oxidoreductase (luciferase family)